jgi:hypothetical protein
LGDEVMDVSDYYAESLTSKIMYNLGRGVKAVNVVTMENINPLKASAAVTVVWGTVSALINIRKYKQGKIAKGEAALATASESVGMGLSAGLGLFVSNLVRTSLVVASVTPSLLPFMTGVIVTTGAKRIWVSGTKKYIGRRYESPEQNEEMSARLTEGLSQPAIDTVSEKQ